MRLITDHLVPTMRHVANIDDRGPSLPHLSLLLARESATGLGTTKNHAGEQRWLASV
jgi:hypothetical protein